VQKIGLFEAIDERGVPLINESTVQYSLLSKYKFQKLTKTPNSYPSLDTAFVGWYYIKPFRSLSQRFKEECIELVLPRRKMEDLYAVHCSRSDVIIDADSGVVDGVDITIIKALVPKDISDLNVVLRSLTVFHFTLNVVLVGNAGLQIFDENGRLTFCSTVPTMRILGQEMIYRLTDWKNETVIIPKGHFQEGKDIAVVLFDAERSMHRVEVLNADGSFSFEPFGNKFFAYFPGRGKVNFQNEEYGTDGLPLTDRIVWDGYMQNAIAYMIVDVTGL
jgi:hypothetical protein